MSRPSTPNPPPERIGSPLSPGDGRRGTRGHACLTCRQSTLKCDGRRPICAQCERHNRAEECEYADLGPSPARVLEQNIQALEQRLQQLQSSRSGPTTEITLHDPYATAPAANPPGFPRILADRASSSNWWASEEPPASVVQYLVHTFLPYAANFGFFLDESRFRSAVLPEIQAGRSSALITCMCLCAASALRVSSLLPLVPRILSRATSQTARALASRRPQDVMHYIQAEVLLAHYYIINGRFLEARQRLSAVAAVILACGLHKIRTSRPATIGNSDLRMPCAVDPVEEGERIIAFWTIVSRDKNWTVAMGESSSLPIPSDRPESQVDTPWPICRSDYAQGRLLPTITSSLTVENFLRGVDNARTPSILAVHAKAAILWERAFLLGKSYRPNMPQQRLATFVATLNSLDTIMAALARRDLPTFFGSRDLGEQRALLAAHGTVYAACIQLHRPVALANPQSGQKMLMAAKEIFSFPSRLAISEMRIVDPMMGSIWLLAAYVVAGELMRLREASRGRASGSERAAADDLSRLMHSALATIEPVSRSIPLLGDRVDKVRQLYTAASSS
ncbi:hypothetical protein EV715DRAFT_210033 [Schizophyllum commune]